MGSWERERGSARAERQLIELMEEEVEDVVGPKGRHDPERTASGHGQGDGAVTLGGRRVGVRRRRAGTGDDEREVASVTYAQFADREPLARVVLERMFDGIELTRRATLSHGECHRAGTFVATGRGRTRRDASAEALAPRHVRR